MAVYTEVTDEDLNRFIARYDVGRLMSYKGIAEGVENTNYLLHTTTAPYILTLYERRVARADLPFFLGFMEHLAEAGVSCPTPVRDKQGKNLNELAGRAAALVTFLEGVWPRRPKPGQCAAVGRALADLHMAGQNFLMTRPNALGIEAWRPLYERFANDTYKISGGLSKVIEQELDYLETQWPNGLTRGIIHADLFPDNVFFIGDSLSGLIDFYFACDDALAYDIAICLNAWCFEDDFTYNAEKGHALLHGYETVRALTPAEREAMPVLGRGATMRFLLTRAYDWLNTPTNAVVKPHDPLDYLHRLRFHQSVRDIRDYGREAL